MIKYTLADIEKYLQGKMSPAEMHALEKAAIQDPFLADAIEGYSSNGINFAAGDLSAIHAALLDSTSTPARSNPVQASKYTWWKVAALLVFVAGAAAISLHFFNRTDLPQQLAQNKIPVSADAKDKLDTNSNNITNSVPSQPSSDIAQRYKKAAPVAATRSKAVLPPPLLASANGTVVNKQEESRNEREELSDVTITSLKDSSFVFKIGSGRTKVAKDSLALVSSDVTMKADTVMYDVQEADKKNKLAAQTTQNATRYVPMGLAGSSRKKTDAAFEKRANAKSFPIIAVVSISTGIITDSGRILNPVPSGGWTAFNQFVTEKTGLMQEDLPRDSSSLTLHIKIVVDKKGKLKTAAVEYGADAHINERTLEAIRERPDWLLFTHKKNAAFSIKVMLYK